ncbi:hypothetical protein AVEN_88983-1 [Araneus ventricosus]|uniref:TRAF-type domain-containing protein n=1 Tax=Araneus ventricosus TaxID=182803 RepID=A0A4Y2DKY4_ARAVE|nr:hypothetical protein AVEN_88983-1 [Araneus ventricosus]
MFRYNLLSVHHLKRQSRSLCKRTESKSESIELNNFKSSANKRHSEYLKTQSHLESCGYVPVSCPCSCGLQVTKKELAQHLTTTCDRRLVSCPFCQEDVVFKDMEEHNELCGKRPVVCPHCKAEVKREQVSSVQSKNEIHFESSVQ